ncbi:MAG: hypothetical protein RMY16_11825 [Nostoc sp. DedQUE12b]|nr:hypothetical protein [Nostoc sp. DedQUE12b]MDZ8086232.1 hypothetical protein [Nostoc sp. DedQUE12b]
MANIVISNIALTQDTESFIHELEEQEIGDVLGGGWYFSLFWGLIEFGSY